MQCVQAAKTTFTLHTYHHSGRFYLQGDSGPIGLRLTCTIARLVLLWFDNTFLEKLTNLHIGVHVYKCYVDDVTQATDDIPAKIVLYRETDSLTRAAVTVENMEGDKHTFSVFQSIADSISPMLSLISGVPSNHEDNEVPCLDLKISKDREDSENKIKYKFYQKPVACYRSSGLFYDSG